MLRISKEHHVHKMNSENSPCAVISSNTRLIVETWDALKGKASEFFESNIPQLIQSSQANPATGPIYVEGAKPLDVLEIKIHDIKCDEWGGFITQKKHMISSKEELTPPELLEFHVQNDYFTSKGQNRRLPLEPMIGVIGTSPQPGVNKWCKEAGDHGANMDAKVIRKGTTLYLPVFVEGALLALGDVHAAMGDGEISGQGIEVGAEIDMTINVVKNMKLRRPLVVLKDRIATIASHEDIYTAINNAILDMGDYLIEHYKLSADDAFSLINYYGNLCFCQVVNPQKTVRMEIEYKYFEYFKNE